MPGRILGLGALTLAVLATPTPAHADGSCSAAAAAWAERCGLAEEARIRPGHCERARVTLIVESDGETLAVEITPRPDGFRQAGKHSLSPIGSFADWSRTSAGTRACLDKLARCVERGVDEESFVSPTAAVVAPVPPRSSAPPRPTAWPGPLFAGLFATVLLLVSRLSAHASRRRLVPALALLGGLVALSVGAFLARWALLPRAFLHQNGQGATWITFALGHPNPYGSGYAELFGRAARRAAGHGEQAVFFLQAIAGATGPLAAWVLARSLGAPRAFALAVAVSLALDPVVGRVAQSESYFSTGASLLLLACASLAAGAHVGLRDRRSLALGGVAYACFVAQAATVHPAIWVPSALTPLVLLGGRGSLRSRIVLTAGITVSAIGVAGLLVGQTLLSASRVNARWGDQARELVRLQAAELWFPTYVIAVVVGGGWVLLRELGVRPGSVPSLAARRFAIRAALAFAVVGVAHTFNGARHVSPLVDRAYTAMFVGPFVAFLSSLVACFRWSRPRAAAWVLALLLVAAAASVHGEARSVARTLPTDVLESNLALEWRGSLPIGAELAYVGRARQRIAELPIYPSDPRRLRVVELGEDGDGRLAELLGSGADSFYYRSSLCSTSDGRARCDALEERLELEVVWERPLPPLPSLPDMVYDRPLVIVALYRVRAIRR